MRRQALMSALLRPQLTHTSPLNWHVATHGFSMSLATAYFFRLAPLRAMRCGQLPESVRWHSSSES
ncbi:hypothetical protein AP060_01802 [Pseudomonas sp. TAD18]|nr:hypothetical protein AP060_01802 [Pseudomonas sp. TAD18]KVV07221.1 hypothetical protein AP059_01745 [Pseudomonas sp. TAA207]